MSARGGGGRYWCYPVFDYKDHHPQDRHYSCRQCGYTLEDEYGEIYNEDQLEDWLMANCPQENQEIDEQNTE